MAINIYHYGSGVTDPSSIQAIWRKDLVRYDNFNRPLQKLVENDQSIITEIAESITTTKAYVSRISANNAESLITVNSDVRINQNLEVIGSQIIVSTKELLIQDNVIRLNAGTSLDATGVGGMQIDRGAGVPADFLFHEEDKFWYASHSGIKGNIADFSTITTSGISASYIDFLGVNEPSDPVAGQYRVWVNTSGISYYKNNESWNQHLGQGTGRYEEFVFGQVEFENYFGVGTLSGTGSTVKGISYSRSGSKVTMNWPNNIKILLDDGQYNLSTYINLSNGATISGRSKNACQINIINSSAGFGNIDVEKIENVELKDFIIDGSQLALAGSKLISIDKIKHSEFDVRIKNVNALYVYKGTLDNENVRILEGCEDNSAVVVNGLYKGFFGGYSKNNTKTIENAESVILNGSFDNTIYLGSGDWDF